MIFGMISTSRSLFYTRKAIESFFGRTKFSPGSDLFVLIVNDHEPEAIGPRDGMRMVVNERPMGFSANVNVVLREALARRDSACILNNDMIFTRGWLDPLSGHSDAILLPMCNQNFSYQSDGLVLSFSLDWDSFGGRYEALETIAAGHRQNLSGIKRHRDLVMPFFCFVLPLAAIEAVGLFDESFGQGGGEDIDYRLRAMLAGFDVAYAAQSYVLHFMGKSTWRSGEPREETNARERGYQNRFLGKWGQPVLDMFLSFADGHGYAAAAGFSHLIERGDYRGLLLRCLDATDLIRVAHDHATAGRHEVALSLYREALDRSECEDPDWRSRVAGARCALSLGDLGSFLRDALAAYDRRPDREEVLSDVSDALGRWGMGNASALFRG